MFTKPGDANVNGVHLVLLDVRYFRSPTFKEKGHCEGGNSTVLGEEQWKWLEQELKKKSKIKVIGTGMQVMQPTDQTFTDVDSYCANDGKTFFDVIDQLGEDKRFLGTKYEGWNQIPQEKARLLRLLQRTIANGDAEKIIIISGDMHWGEMMAKKMSAAAGVGPSQVIYEVTASGIDKNFPYPDSNANRLRIRSADSVGDGVFQHECKFPFKSEGIEYNDCISTNEEVPWCATIVDSENNYFPGDWGYCLPEDQELVPRANITASGENSCYEKLHVCKARANYGGIEVDWDNSVIKLSLFTPHANDNVAAQVTIGL
jgi:alkaline phosphatase D